MNEGDKDFIKLIVQETIRELKKNGMLRSASDIAYSEATAVLRSYYKDGETDKTVERALNEVKDDPYFKIVPLYFSYGYTIEEIAEAFHADTSTISRNKKRLCLEVYGKIE